MKEQKEKEKQKLQKREKENKNKHLKESKDQKAQKDEKNQKQPKGEKTMIENKVRKEEKKVARQQVEAKIASGRRKNQRAGLVFPVSGVHNQMKVRDFITH